MMSTCLQIQKKKKQSRDVISVLGGETVVLGQTAHWYASQREWYLISPSRIEAEADKQMDLLCLECSLGELDGLRYRDAAFVLEPARGIIRPFGEWTKHRVIGTQRHTCSYTQSISQYLCLCSPFSLFQPTYLSVYKLTFILLATMLGLSLCILAAQVCWFSWLSPSLRCQPSVMSDSHGHDSRQPFFRRLSLCVGACAHVRSRACASHPSRHEWASKSRSLPPLFPLSISSFLPL